MPVHLFGRPAPLDELTQLGVPIIEDAAQAFGAPGRRVSTGIVSTFSFFPTKNLFCLGDGGLVASTDDELADRVRHARASTARATRRTFDYVGYNSRLDELQAAMLRLFLTHLDEWNAARREAAARYAELGLGELCELPGRRARPRLPPVRRAGRPSATAIAAALARRGDRPRRVLRDAAPPPAGAALPRLGGRARCRRRSGLAREPRAAALGGDRRPRRRSASSTSSAAVGERGTHERCINRHRLWQLAVDAGLIVARVVPRLPAPVRPPSCPPYYEHAALAVAPRSSSSSSSGSSSLFGFYNRWWRYVSTQDMWARRARRVVACARLEPRRLLRRARRAASACRGRSRSWTGCCCSRSSPARGMLARTIIERPSRGGLVARGKEVIVVGAGDAGQLIVKEMLQLAGRSGTRRSGSSTTTRASRNLRVHGVRVLGTTADLPRILREQQPGRGAHRDPVRPGRDARSASSTPRGPRASP